MNQVSILSISISKIQQPSISYLPIHRTPNPNSNSQNTSRQCLHQQQSKLKKETRIDIPPLPQILTGISQRDLQLEQSASVSPSDTLYFPKRFLFTPPVCEWVWHRPESGLARFFTLLWRGRILTWLDLTWLVSNKFRDVLLDWLFVLGIMDHEW